MHARDIQSEPSRLKHDSLFEQKHVGVEAWTPQTTKDKNEGGYPHYVRCRRYGSGAYVRDHLSRSVELVLQLICFDDFCTIESEWAPQQIQSHVC
jgi:hypothetical protein